MTSPPHPAPSIRPDPLSGAATAMSLLRHGYCFWEQTRQRQGSEIVQTRLLRERVTAVRGPAGAQFFYETTSAQRASALPQSLVGALFGRGGVQLLDGSAHAHRKSMINDILGAQASADVSAAVGQLWDDRVPRWSRRVDVVQETAEMLFDIATEWVGLPGSGQLSGARARDMLALVDGFGAPTRRQLAARAARKRLEAWVQAAVVHSRRAGHRETPLDVVAAHRDENGDLLDEHTAAVEVINLVRPLVAISWLVSGVLVAFDRWPQRRAEVIAESLTPMEVSQEVRRTYPLTPFLATRATQHLTFQDVAIASGTLIVLDVWGTNHDPHVWTDPDTFDPRRFRTTPVTPYNLVPQGGGDRRGHRCPGEDATLAVLMTLVPRLADLGATVVGPRPGLRRMPPRPRLVIKLR